MEDDPLDRSGSIDEGRFSLSQSGPIALPTSGRVRRSSSGRYISRSGSTSPFATRRPSNPLGILNGTRSRSSSAASASGSRQQSPVKDGDGVGEHGKLNRRSTAANLVSVLESMKRFRSKVQSKTQANIAPQPPAAPTADAGEPSSKPDLPKAQTQVHMDMEDEDVHKLTWDELAGLLQEREAEIQQAAEYGRLLLEDKEELEQRNEELEDDMEEMQLKVEDLYGKLSEANGRVSVLTQEKTTLSAKNQEYLAHLDENDKLMTKLEERIQELTRSGETSAKLDRKTKALEQEIGTLKDTIHTLEKQLEDERVGLAAKDREIHRLKAQNIDGVELEVVKNSLTEEIEALQEEMGAVKADNVSLKTDLQQKKAQLSANASEIQQQSLQIQSLTEKIHSRTMSDSRESRILQDARRSLSSRHSGDLDEDDVDEPELTGEPLSLEIEAVTPVRQTETTFQLSPSQEEEWDQRRFSAASSQYVVQELNGSLADLKDEFKVFREELPTYLIHQTSESILTPRGGAATSNGEGDDEASVPRKESAGSENGHFSPLGAINLSLVTVKQLRGVINGLAGFCAEDTKSADLVEDVASRVEDANCHLNVLAGNLREAQEMMSHTEEELPRKPTEQGVQWPSLEHVNNVMVLHRLCEVQHNRVEQSVGSLSALVSKLGPQVGGADENKETQTMNGHSNDGYENGSPSENGIAQELNRTTDIAEDATEEETGKGRAKSVAFEDKPETNGTLEEQTLDHKKWRDGVEQELRRLRAVSDNYWKSLGPLPDWVATCRTLGDSNVVSEDLLAQIKEMVETINSKGEEEASDIDLSVHLEAITNEARDTRSLLENVADEKFEAVDAKVGEITNVISQLMGKFSQFEGMSTRDEQRNEDDHKKMEEELHSLREKLSEANIQCAEQKVVMAESERSLARKDEELSATQSKAEGLRKVVSKLVEFMIQSRVEQTDLLCHIEKSKNLLVELKDLIGTDGALEVSELESIVDNMWDEWEMLSHTFATVTNEEVLNDFHRCHEEFVGTGLDLNATVTSDGQENLMSEASGDEEMPLEWPLVFDEMKKKATILTRENSEFFSRMYGLFVDNLWKDKSSELKSMNAKLVELRAELQEKTEELNGRETELQEKDALLESKEKELNDAMETFESTHSREVDLEVELERLKIDFGGDLQDVSSKFQSALKAQANFRDFIGSIVNLKSQLDATSMQSLVRKEHGVPFEKLKNMSNSGIDDVIVAACSLETQDTDPDKEWKDHLISLLKEFAESSKMMNVFNEEIVKVGMEKAKMYDQQFQEEKKRKAAAASAPPPPPPPANPLTAFTNMLKKKTPKQPRRPKEGRPSGSGRNNR